MTHAGLVILHDLIDAILPRRRSSVRAVGIGLKHILTGRLQGYNPHFVQYAFMKSTAALHTCMKHHTGVQLSDSICDGNHMLGAAANLTCIWISTCTHKCAKSLHSQNYLCQAKCVLVYMGTEAPVQTVKGISLSVYCCSEALDHEKQACHSLRDAT